MRLFGAAIAAIAMEMVRPSPQQQCTIRQDKTLTYCL
jgi:hypothetical protein